MTRKDRRRRRRHRMWLERTAALALTVALAAGAVLLLAGGRHGDDVAGSTEAALATTAATAPAGTPVAAPARPTSPAPRPRSGVRVSAVGDIALNGAPPDGGAALFANVDGLLAGDVVLGNLEGTLTSRGVSKCGEDAEPDRCFAFRADPAVAARLADAGFTVLNVANNHSGDFGPTGLQDTVAAARGAGMEATGHLGSVAFATVRRSTELRPTKVAILGFAPYASSNPLLDIEAARRVVRRADERADLVVVTMHAGAEGADHAHVAPGEETHLGERRGDAVAFAKGVIDAGADLVLGHGPHVLRGMEVYKDRLIAYSLGNFATHRALDVTGAGGESAVLTTTLAPDGRLVAARIHPVRIAESGVPAPGGDAIATIRALSHEDFGDAAPRIAGNGSVRP